MTLPISQATLVNFLIDAKRHTYAAQGDEASVPALLTGSRQLEFQDGPLLSRDIYFGSAYFVGQETVYHAESPLWAMGYAGGLLSPTASAAEAGQVYGFLRAALRRGEPHRLYRGPNVYREGACTYTDESHGELAAFWGVETITHADKPVYELRYHGGRLR